MTPLTVAVIVGSTREGRYGDKPARWIVERMAGRSDLAPELVDLRDYPLPLFDRAIPPARAKPGDYGHPVAEAWAHTVARADAFVITAAEYNHGYTPSLKNALDWIVHEWAYKPVSFVGYGGVGGARAIEQLRQVAVELQLAPITQAVHLPLDVFRATIGQPYDPERFAPANGQADAMLDRLAWWGKALRHARSG